VLQWVSDVSGGSQATTDRQHHRFGEYMLSDKTGDCVTSSGTCIIVPPISSVYTP